MSHQAAGVGDGGNGSSVNSDQRPSTLLLYLSVDEEWERLKTLQEVQRRPSLGMQYLMAALTRDGYPFQYRDQVVQDFTLEDVLDEVNDQGHSIVGIHCNVVYYQKVCRYVAALKEKTRARVIVGGPGTSLASEFIAAGADCVVKGEAEFRLTAIIDALTGNGNLDGIPGVVFRNPLGEARETPPASQITNLDTLPFPYRPPELVPLYGEEINPVSHRPNISIMASRGCPFRCSFCSSHEVWQSSVRTRSPENVLDEVAHVLQRWPNAYFSFVDDIFGQNAVWVEQFCRQVLERGLQFKWMCILHPLCFPKNRANLIPLMKAAGCNCISFGAQSNSPDILKNIRRYAHEPRELAQAIALCKANNIIVVVTYIFGLPGDTPETLEENIRFALMHRPHLADFHPLSVLPTSHIDREFRGQDKQITALSQDEIERHCADAFRRFYLRPAAVWLLLRTIVRDDPRHVIKLWPAIKKGLQLMLPQREFKRPLSTAQPDRAWATEVTKQVAPEGAVPVAFEAR
ncbi:MAG: radical SAM protein [Deltaproteobacteria bacterium]|nr:radical SAM protein [Deltaproteobacteria bacterium]